MQSQSRLYIRFKINSTIAYYFTSTKRCIKYWLCTSLELFKMYLERHIQIYQQICLQRYQTIVLGTKLFRFTLFYLMVTKLLTGLVIIYKTLWLVQSLKMSSINENCWSIMVQINIENKTGLLVYFNKAVVFFLQNNKLFYSCVWWIWLWRRWIWFLQ